MNAIRTRITDEPVLTLALVQAAIALVVAFGLDLSGEQTAALWVFAAAALGWVARQNVKPLAHLPAPAQLHYPSDEDNG